MARSIQIVIDCLDPAALAPFWARLLGYKLQDPPAGYSSWEAFLKDQGVPEECWNSANAVIDPEGMGPRIYFQQVKEQKINKNRLHMDVNVSGNLAQTMNDRRIQINRAVEETIGYGAKKVQEYEENGQYWVVMQDPEGNEFCLQ